MQVAVQRNGDKHVWVGILVCLLSLTSLKNMSTNLSLITSCLSNILHVECSLKPYYMYDCKLGMQDVS